MTAVPKDYDIVIVGSGAGGGTVAKELSAMCKDGVRIAVLEQGPKLREDEYTGRESEMAQKLYVDNGGMMTSDGTMTLAMGRLLGGSTVVYTGTSIRLPEHVAQRWAVPGLDWADLVGRSAKYMEENNVHLQEPEKINDNNRLFFEGCKALGYSVEQFPINVKGCKGSGLCNLGCPNAAKQGTLRVQLPAAAANGVELVTNCRVDRIDGRTLHARIESRDYGEPSDWAPGEYTITAKAIVVSSGAIGSPALLFRSGYGEKLPMLGRYFTAHPALILVGQHSGPITNYQGHPKSYFCDEYMESERYLLETCMYFPFVTAKSLSGFGPEHSRLMADMRKLQMILVLALDPAEKDNRVAIDKDGNPIVHYAFHDTTVNALVHSQRTSTRIFFAGGAERVHAPSADRFFIEKDEAKDIDTIISRDNFKLGKISIASAHLMGGCRMGSGTDDSVTDAWGRVHGEPGLYVADASLFPQCSEVNPYLTIMGLADRVAEKVRQDFPELIHTETAA